MMIRANRLAMKWRDSRQTTNKQNKTKKDAIIKRSENLDTRARDPQVQPSTGGSMDTFRRDVVESTNSTAGRQHPLGFSRLRRLFPSFVLYNCVHLP